MRDGWKYIPFESSIQKVKYTTKVPSSDYLLEGDYPIVSQEEGLISGYWNNSDDVFHHDKSVVIFGDHTRIIKYVDFDFVLGADGVKILLPIEGLSARFLFYYLQWLKVPSLGYSRHYKLLKETTVPIPPTSEQQRIVADLDLLQGVIDKQKAQLKELDTLAQSIFYDMFGNPVTNEKGWPVSTLLGISSGKLSYGSGASATEYDGKTRYIRITDIDDNGELRGEPASPNEVAEKYLLNEGDILFARTGATVGKTYLHKRNNGRCIYAGYLIRLIPDTSRVIPQFVFGFTKTQYYKSFVSLAQKAVAQPNINAEQYGNLAIVVPPLSIQQHFAEKIEAIEQQKANINAAIAETQKLFDYTMDKYFG